MRRGPKTEPKRHIDADSLPPHGPKRVTHFIETYCRVPKGTKTVPAGSPVVLRPWQKDILNGLYSDPRPRQGLVSVARKNGKTLLAACLALYHLVADDEASAEILVVSSDERTAQVTFKLARRMVELDDTLRECIQVWKEQLYIPRTDCIMEVLSGDASRAQGRNPSFAIVDEVHVTDPDCWDALALGQATRARPLILGISTECGPNEPENLMARLVGHGRNANDPDFFFREFTAPANCDTHDRRAWESANPQLYDTLDADHLAALVRTTRESQFRRYHLNQRVATEGAWLPLGAWDACSVLAGADGAAQGRESAILAGSDVVLALDGSFSGDATALVACTVDPLPHLDVIALWEPPNDDPGYRVDVADVEDMIRTTCQRLSVREICADPYRWTRSLQALEAEGLPMVEFPQSPSRMAPATAALYEAVMNRQATHSGNPDLARHVGNAHVKDDARGVRLTKQTKWSKLRIDLAVCAVMAHSRALFFASQPAKRTRRVVTFKR